MKIGWTKYKAWANDDDDRLGDGSTIGGKSISVPNLLAFQQKNK